MQSLIRKAFDAWRLYKFGIFSITLNKLSPETFSYQNFILYSFDLKKRKGFVPKNKDSVTIKKIHNHHEKLFKRFREKFPADEFLARIKQINKTCYIALKDEEVVGYAWISERELYIESIDYRFSLNEDEIFIYACYVSKENRGEGIYPAMLQEILYDYSKGDKFRLAYIGVLSMNRGSNKGVKKAGFKEKNRIRYLKWLNNEKRWGLGQDKQQVGENLFISLP